MFKPPQKHVFVLVAVVFMISAACCPLAAWAGERGETRAPHVVSPGAGYAEIFDDDPVAFWGLEFRPGFRFHRIGTWFFFGTGEGETHYASAGILADFPLGERWMITPAFGAGYYREGEDGLILGHETEFRSSLEVSWRFKNGHRLGLKFAHLSNGSLSDINPGTESLQVNWLIPLGRSGHSKKPL
jgi:hypothetical protein